MSVLGPVGGCIGHFLATSSNSVGFPSRSPLQCPPCQTISNKQSLLHLVQVTIEKMVDEDLIQITHPRYRWRSHLAKLSIPDFQLRTLPAIAFENVWCHKLVDWIQGLLSKTSTTGDHPVKHLFEHLKKLEQS